jgi:hypothetical protein
MTYIRSRVFCCCLPVRFGVFVMTVLGALGGSAVAVLAWIQTQRMKGQISNTDEIALYVHASIYTLLGVLSIVGFIGACSRSPTLISIYFSMLVAHLGFSIFSGAFSLYSLFHGDGKAMLNQCISLTADDVAKAATNGVKVDGEKECQRALTIFKVVAVGAFIIIWLLEIYGCFIVHDYSAQLDEEDFIKLPPHRDAETAQINLGRPATEYGP